MRHFIPTPESQLGPPGAKHHRELVWGFTLHLVSISILAILFASAALPAQAEPNANPEVRAVYNPPSAVKLDAKASETKFFSGLTGTYRLGLSLVGISALLMIVWGGINYIIARDDSSKVTAAKEKIRNALIGILIAATSYALLKTINPDLVNFQIRLPALRGPVERAPEAGYPPTIRDPRFERGPVEVRSQSDIGTAPTGQVSNLSQCQGATVFDQRCSDACRNSGGQYIQQPGIGGVGYKYNCQR